MALVNQMIEKVNRLERRLALQETIEMGAGGGSYSNEDAQDAVGGMFSGNVETDIAVTYQDATAKVDFVVNQSLVEQHIHAATGKTTPVDADELGLVDSAASNVLKKLTWANLKATLLTYFTTLFVLLAGKSGGQTINGDTASGGNLTLQSTAHATKGKIFLGSSSAYDGANVRLGVGGIDPVGEIESVSVSSANAVRGLTSTQHNDGAQAAIINFRKSRGDRAAQTTVSNGDFIGDFVFQPYDGTNYLRTVQIAAKVNGTVATASVPTDIIFAAGDTDDSSLTNERMRIKSTGEIVIGSAASQGMLNILQATLGNSVMSLVSVATNDDPTELVYQNRVTTANNTVTTLHTFTLANNTTYTLDVWVTARRTAGSGVGAANDGAGVHMNGTYKGMTGTATIVGTLTVVSSNLDTSMAAVTMTVSGATVLVRVTGTTSNTITWHMTARVNLVSS